MFPNAKELRAKSNQTLEFMEELEHIKGCVISAASQGEKKVNVHLPDQMMFGPLADYLIEKGYKVEWNKACLWMEIHW